MLLKNHSLGQIDEGYIRSLSHEDLIKLSTKLLEDLKEAREQLNQGPTNSSRPPSSQVPWESGEELEEEDEPSAEDSGRGEDEPKVASGKAEDAVAASNTQEEAPKQGKAGKPKGAAGYGRTQQVVVTHTVDHRVESDARRCAATKQRITCPLSKRAHNTSRYIREQRPKHHWC